MKQLQTNIGERTMRSQRPAFRLSTSSGQHENLFPLVAIDSLGVLSKASCSVKRLPGEVGLKSRILFWERGASHHFKGKFYLPRMVDEGVISDRVSYEIEPIEHVSPAMRR